MLQLALQFPQPRPTMTRIGRGGWWRMHPCGVLTDERKGQILPRIQASRELIDHKTIRWHWSVELYDWPDKTRVQRIGDGWARRLSQAMAAADSCAVTNGIIPFGEWVTGYR